MAKNTTVKNDEMNEEVTTQNVNNDGTVIKEAATVKNEEEKVKITIPQDPLNKNDAYVPVAINGNITQIMRGKEVEVSKEIARILKEAGYIA